MKYHTLLFILISAMVNAQTGQTTTVSEPVTPHESTQMAVRMQQPSIFDASEFGIAKIDTSTKGYESGTVRVRRVTIQNDTMKKPALGYHIYYYKLFEDGMKACVATLLHDSAFTEVTAMDVRVDRKSMTLVRDSVIRLQFYCGRCRKNNAYHYTLIPPAKKEDAVVLKEGFGEW